jgi:hypothetical protein
MNIAVNLRNSTHLAEPAERTNLEGSGNDVLLRPAEVRSGPNGMDT